MNGPFSHIDLAPTGGVNLQRNAVFKLVDTKALYEGRLDVINEARKPVWGATRRSQ